MKAEPKFDALPVRRREILETFDTGIKLYKRYFWVLLAWAAIANVISGSISLIPVFGIILGSTIGFLLVPFQYGSVACCIAAAVRGQPISFMQCYAFSRVRYWAVLGQYILATIVAGTAIVGVIILISVLAGLLIGLLSFVNVPTAVAVIFWVLVGLVLIVVTTVVGSVAWGWMMMAPLVVCLENDKRNSNALSRTWTLMAANWWRVTGLYSVFGAAFLALLIMLTGLLGLVAGLEDIQKVFTGTMPDTDRMMAGLASFSVVWILICVLAMPMLYLVTGVFYLDLRVRKEALDLEWSAHVTAPPNPTPDGQVDGTVAPGSLPAEPAPAVLAPAVPTAAVLAPGEPAPTPPEPVFNPQAGAARVAPAGEETQEDYSPPPSSFAP